VRAASGGVRARKRVRRRCPAPPERAQKWDARNPERLKAGCGS
jgi:hypothetical protein